MRHTNGNGRAPMGGASMGGFLGLPTWEWVGVGIVGLVAGGILRTVGLSGALLGAVTYMLGYGIRGQRPALGWDPRAYLPRLPPASPPAALPPPED